MTWLSLSSWADSISYDIAVITVQGEKGTEPPSISSFFRLTLLSGSLYVAPLCLLGG